MACSTCPQTPTWGTRPFTVRGLRGLGSEGPSTFEEMLTAVAQRTAHQNVPLTTPPAPAPDVQPITWDWIMAGVVLTVAGVGLYLHRSRRKR